MAAYCLLGKGRFLISWGSLSLIQTPTVWILEVPLVRKDGDIVSTLRDTLGWMNKELGGLWLFLIGQEKVWGRPGQAGIDLSIPFHAWLQKPFPFYSHCLLDLRPFLVLSYECLFLLDFIGTCNIYVAVTFQRSLRDWLFTFRTFLEGLQSPLCFFQERHLVRTKANNWVTQSRIPCGEGR